jgi:hypothetical protein
MALISQQHSPPFSAVFTSPAYAPYKTDYSQQANLPQHFSHIRILLSQHAQRLFDSLSTLLQVLAASHSRGESSPAVPNDQGDDGNHESAKDASWNRQKTVQISKAAVYIGLEGLKALIYTRTAAVCKPRRHRRTAGNKARKESLGLRRVIQAKQTQLPSSCAKICYNYRRRAYGRSRTLSDLF